MMLKVGDIVRLRSGGPNMSIVSIKDGCCECAWFKNDDTLGQATFPIALLGLSEKIDNETQKKQDKALSSYVIPRGVG
ncbi:YodC family protein [Aeromonas veronii]|uniref:YodC family protein n=2 Tax=Aeromonas veronii TaxID=654 RepID=UPI0038B624A5